MRTGKRPVDRQAVNEKQILRTQPIIPPTGYALCEGLFFVLAGLVLFFFLVRPCFSTADSPIRFIYMLLPILEPRAILEHFWGTDLAPFSFATLGLAVWQRAQTLFLAVVCLTAATGLGEIVLRLEQVCTKRNQQANANTGWNQLEHFFFACAAGLALWSGLLCWLGIAGLARMPFAFGMATYGLVLFTLWRLIQSVRRPTQQKNVVKKRTPLSAEACEKPTELFGHMGTVLLILFLTAFVLVYLLGAMIPTCEYDMLEYHLQGAREFYESGRIAFASHNVYMNMPLGVEMFHLWGMNLTGNTFTGALVGKTLIALTGVLAALGVALLVHRVTNSAKYSLLASIVYLSFPGNFDVFTNGLNDGVLGMMIIAVLLLLLPGKSEQGTREHPLLTGLILGMAVACKYTGIVFVLFPILLVVVIARFRKGIELKFAIITLFLLAFLFVCGGWFFKNMIATGNPFHPLAYSILGDTSGTWDTARNLRWTRVHSPDGFAFQALLNSFSSFSWTSITASPFFALTLLAGILALPRLILFSDNATTGTSEESTLRKSCPSRKTILVLTVACLYYLVLWWTATHRIERFLAPLLPVVATLFVLFCYTIFSKSGSSRAWRSGWLLLFALWYPLAFSPMLQTNYLLPYQILKQDVARFGDWSIWFNSHPEVRTEATGKTLLLIGQAQAFSYEGSIMYNTCWDTSPLTSVLEGNVRYDQNRETVVEITQPQTIREKLKERGIGWILFDEGEWRRFRGSGNYGLTDPAINGQLLQLLVTANVLERYVPGVSAEFSSYTKQNISVFRLSSKM